MSKNIELMESAIASNNQLLIAKLKLEEDWTDEEIQLIEQKQFKAVLLNMKKHGKILNYNQIMKLIGDENYYGN